MSITDQAIGLAAWEHERRGWHGEWGSGTGPEMLRALPSGPHTSGDYKRAIKAKTARNVRRGDWIAWADTVPVAGGLGNVFRPVQVLSARHKTRGRGSKRHAYVTLVLDNGDTQELRAGSRVDTMDPGKLGGAPPGPTHPKPANLPPPPTPTPNPAGSSPVPAPHPYGKDHFGQVVDDWPVGGTEQAVAEVQHGLDIQGGKVPGLAKLKITITEDLRGADDDPNALGETLPDNEIQVKPEVTRAYAGPGAEEMLVDDQSSGWWVPIDSKYTLADSVVGHEMGHVVASNLMDHPGAGSYDSMRLWGAIAKATGVPPPHVLYSYKGDKRADLPRWLDENQASIAMIVSKYGGTNLQELMAELWAEYSLSSSPRPAARIYGEWAMKYLPDSARAAA